MEFVCDGNGEDHCCYVAGKPCEFLRTDVPGRKWACGLLVELGDWDLVHKDPRYLEGPQKQWDKKGIIENCGDWMPRPNSCCRKPR